MSSAARAGHERKAAGETIRPEIQALRALAVLLVIAYHLWPSMLPGGFVGVDVFFVISGFLITAHLLREALATGTVRVTYFWARRIRRLLPAAFLVLLASFAATLIWLPRAIWQQTFEEIGASALYGVNWLLAWNATDYLAADNTASIVQHYWSLSVEEQFYLAWPLLILLAVAILGWLLPSKKAGSDSRSTAISSAIAVALAAVFVASLTYSILETANSQPSAYFMTPTRAWEFAAGGLLAFVPATLFSRFGESTMIVVRSIGSWTGLVAIGMAAVMFSGDSMFPGYIALLPVLGTVLVIWAGNIEHPWAPTAVAGFGPLQAIGDLSYSIYLWHWPLIVAYPLVRGHEPELKGGLLIIAASIALAWITKHVVEDPVRTGAFWTKNRRRAYSLAALGMAVLLVLSTLLWWSVQRANDQLAADAAAALADPCFGASAMVPSNRCVEPFARTATVDTAFAADDDFSALAEGQACHSWSHMPSEPLTCVLGEVRHPRRTLALVGDSHAAHLRDALALYAKQSGYRLLVYTRSACPVLDTADEAESADELSAAESATCLEWASKVMGRLLGDDSIDAVVFGNFTESPHVPIRSTAEPKAIWKQLSDAGKQLFAIRDVPGMPPGVNAPECIATSPVDNDPCSSPREQVLPSSDIQMQAVREMSDEVVLIDLSDYFCDPRLCHAVIGGLIVYRDNAHLTMTFSRTLAPYLGELIEDHLR